MGVFRKELGDKPGRIWDSRPTTTRSGVMTVLVNRKTRSNQVRIPNFVGVSFGRKGEELAVVDERGTVNVLQLLANKYFPIDVGRGIGSRALITFSPTDQNEFVVARIQSDGCTIQSFNSQSAQAHATLKEHRTPLRALAYHPSASMLISASSDKAILWDTDTWKKRKTLKHGGAIAGACFLSHDDTLVIAYTDGRILGWGAHTFKLQMELNTPPPVAPSPTFSDRDLAHRASHQLTIKCIAGSHDSRLLVAGCQGAYLVVWDTNTKRVFKVVTLPEATGSILQVLFVKDVPLFVRGKEFGSHYVAALGEDGCVHIVDIGNNNTNTPQQQEEQEQELDHIHEEAAIVHCVQLDTPPPQTPPMIIFFALDSECRYMSACASDGTMSLIDLNCSFEHALRQAQAIGGAPRFLTSPRTQHTTPGAPASPWQPSSVASKSDDKVEEVDLPRGGDAWVPSSPAIDPVLSAHQKAIGSPESRKSSVQSSRGSMLETGRLSDIGSWRSLNVESTLGRNRQKHTNKPHQRSARIESTSDSEVSQRRRVTNRGRSKHQQKIQYQQQEQEEQEYTLPSRPPIVSLVQDLSSGQQLMNRSRLRNIIDHFGSFPERYRFLIWRFLLQLPDNKEAFDTLQHKGPHSVWENLDTTYPMRSQRLANKLRMHLSMLSHWSPVFSEVSYLPAMAFPFISCFQNSDVVAFEVLLVVILNWTESWFEAFPHPPIPLLTAIDTALSCHDRMLFDHLQACDVSSRVYAWPLLRSLFTEVLDREDWLKLWDFFVSRHETPHLLNVAVVAYLSYFRTALLSLTRPRDFDLFFRTQNALIIGRFTKLILRVDAALPADVRERLSGNTKAKDQILTGQTECKGDNHGIPTSPSENENYALDKNAATTISEKVSANRDRSKALLPIGGQYPVFYRYPKFVVDFRKQERERIEAEENELLRKRQLIRNLERRTKELDEEETEWRAFQTRLMKEEEQRSVSEQTAFEKRHRERMLLLNQERTRKLEQVAKMEESARGQMQVHRQLREAEAKRLQQELERRARVEDAELEAQREGEVVKGVEFEATRRIVDLAARRQLETELMELRQSMLARNKTTEAERNRTQARWEEEDESRNVKLRTLKQTKEKEAQMLEMLASRRELESAALLSEMEQEAAQVRQDKDRKMRQLAEEEMLQAEQELRAKRAISTAMDKEEQREKEELVRQHKQFLSTVAHDRESVLEKEKKQLELDGEMRALRVQELDRARRRREFEESITLRHAEERERLLAEEKVLQNKLAELEKKRMDERQREMEMALREREGREQIAMTRASNQALYAELDRARAEFMGSRDEGRRQQQIEQQQQLERQDQELAELYISQERIRIAAIAETAGGSDDRKNGVDGGSRVGNRVGGGGSRGDVSGAYVDSPWSAASVGSPSDLALQARAMIAKHEERRRELESALEESVHTPNSADASATRVMNEEQDDEGTIGLSNSEEEEDVDNERVIGEVDSDEYDSRDDTSAV